MGTTTELRQAGDAVTAAGVSTWFQNVDAEDVLAAFESIVRPTARLVEATGANVVGMHPQDPSRSRTPAAACARTVRPMRHVVMLGTGTPNVDPDRAGSGVALVASSAWLLVDIGRGVTQRVMQADLDLTRLSAVLLTHHHSDHITDLATLAITRWTAGATTPLRVVCPACESVADLARSADVLVHEALDPDRVRQELLAWNAAADAVGELAQRAGVRQLVLTHVIPTPGSLADEHHLIELARAGGYRGEITVAHDLDRIELAEDDALRRAVELE